MLYPSINELLTKVDNRYELVIAVAKRSREIIEEQESQAYKEKPVSLATDEIYDGRLMTKKDEQ